MRKFSQMNDAFVLTTCRKIIAELKDAGESPTLDNVAAEFVVQQEDNMRFELPKYSFGRQPQPQDVSSANEVKRRINSWLGKITELCKAVSAGAIFTPPLNYDVFAMRQEFFDWLPFTAKQAAAKSEFNAGKATEATGLLATFERLKAEQKAKDDAIEAERKKNETNANVVPQNGELVVSQ